MVKTNEKIFIILVFMVFLISIISANSDAGEPSHLIDTQYAPSDYITGWINISLENEPTNSLFETSGGDEITLIKLLDLNDADYDCIPADCGTHYEAGNAATTKEFILDDGNESVIGLKLSGGIVNDISRFSMKVESSALGSIKPRLFIDILNDGEIDWWPHIASPGRFAGENFGCYEPRCAGTATSCDIYHENQTGCTNQDGCSWSIPVCYGNATACSSFTNSINCENQDGCTGNFKYTNTIAEITQREYCEKITIYPAPEVEIGAYVVETLQGGGEIDFTMVVHDNIGWEDFSCNVHLSGEGRVSCIPSDFSVVEKQDFFVCISTDIAGAHKYSLPYETNDVCGFSGSFFGEYSFDFKIFANPVKYAAIGNFILNHYYLTLCFFRF